MRNKGCVIAISNTVNLWADMIKYRKQTMNIYS